MFWRSPVFLVSLLLTSCVVALILLADALSYIPSRAGIELKSRQSSAEALGMLAFHAADSGDWDSLQATFDSWVARAGTVRSAAIRDAAGELLLATRDHPALWGSFEGDQSTITHVVLPILNGSEQWGQLEVRFAELSEGSIADYFQQSTYHLLLVLGPVTFIAFFLILRRILRELDPAAVIPERVNTAFNTLAEGLLVIDEDQRIVLANNPFATHVGFTPKKLLGRKLSELNWQVQVKPEDASDSTELPWLRALGSRQSCTGVPLLIETDAYGEAVFLVNCSPIMGVSSKVRGALVTFDDITEMETNRAHLKESLEKLEQSSVEIQRKNQELHFLATRDPLTGSLNRRSLNEQFEQLFNAAVEQGLPLSCLMTDIDHFKSINDTYGHAVGDKAIKLLAEVLNTATRTGDLVARFGGEEFCIVLPGSGPEEAMAVAERIRELFAQTIGPKIGANKVVTCSLGVSSAVTDAKAYSEMITQADTALYVAKKSGRNRCTAWEGEVTEKALAALMAEEKAAKEPSASAQANADVLHRLHELEAVAQAQSQELKYLANFDVLSGLPNRTAFQDMISHEIARAQRDSDVIAVLAIGVDMLERIKSAYGFQVGETLLHEVVCRVANILRSSDVVAHIRPIAESEQSVSRLEADKFGVMLTSIKQEESITWVVKRISDVLANVFNVEDQNVFLSSTIGISVFPRDGETAEALIGRASVARLHAQNQGETHAVQFYADDINRQSIETLRLAGDLRMALARGELKLVYQPIVATSNGTMHGAEALLRWQHAERGMVGPDVFIPIAEATGLIVEIGYWVVATACQQIRQWDLHGIRDFSVSVNVSAVQFREPELADRILAIIAESGVPPERLSVEITESTFIYDFELAGKTIRRLRDAGVAICADDFGTGYSSLLYLKDLPISQVKIDRSFIRDLPQNPSDAKMVAAILAMARSMNARCVAEGVETETQHELLRAAGCDSMQGYLFGRPMDPQSLQELWHKNRLPTAAA